MVTFNSGVCVVSLVEFPGNVNLNGSKGGCLTCIYLLSYNDT